MSTENPREFSNTDEESDHDSDDNSKLVIECSTPEKKLTPGPSVTEQQILEGIEDELEKRLEEKASKTKLNAINVKSIIRQIITDKNVLALIRKVEDPDCSDDFEPEYEPKLTRAKAKELLSTTPSKTPLPPIALLKLNKNVSSKVQSHIKEDLLIKELRKDIGKNLFAGHQNKGTENNEGNEKDNSRYSIKYPFVPTSTSSPTSTYESKLSNSCSEDAYFKIPSKTISEYKEANIAKRTRSKLSLSTTPLENLEESFVPPDIPTDMCNVQCDNEDWMDFLKNMMRPLDEIEQSTEHEDEEQDPEFNVLSGKTIEIDPECEPKLTRAKAKEILSAPSSEGITLYTWSAPSLLRALLTNDLQEEESGEDEEYIPHDELEMEKDENDDDRDSSICSSNPPSVPPPTPPTPSSPDHDTDFSTHWSEDGLFKIPHTKCVKTPEDANIAKRTRSKLSLTSTTLEKIEEAFVPPDVETENEDWLDFLKEFTKPLDEIVKSTEQEDEEQDPEYNILTDEELDEIDKEELRVDKAVKITKKEFSTLIAELIQYTDEYCRQVELDKAKEDEKNRAAAEEQTDEVQELDTTLKDRDVVLISDGEPEEEIIIEINQYLLLEQQLRQHVQMLTQNFILTYAHPEWSHLSSQLKEYLLNFKFLSESKKRSSFLTVNLKSALKFIEEWELIFEANGAEAQGIKTHIEETIATSIDRKRVGSEFIATFPPLMMEKMSKSCVFLYPSLLPKIPLKSPRIISEHFVWSTPSEDGLIAFGLEDFFEFIKQDKPNLSKSSRQCLQLVCNYISTYTVPYKNCKQIMKLVQNRRLNRCAMNPIKYFFTHNRCLPIVQHVTHLDKFKIQPPCQRSCEELPYQWRTFIYSDSNFNAGTASPSSKFYRLGNGVSPVINVVPAISHIAPHYPIKLETSLIQGSHVGIITPNGSFVQSPVPQIGYQYWDRLLLPKGPILIDKDPSLNIPRKTKRGCERKCLRNSIDTPLKNFVKCLCQRSQVTKLSSIFSYDSNDLEDLIEKLDVQVKNIEQQTPDKFIETRKKILITPIRSQSYSQIISSTINTMLPSMPNLGTPIKTNINPSELPNNQPEISEEQVSVDQQDDKSDHNLSSVSSIDSGLNDTKLTNADAAPSSDKVKTTQKDNLNDINALLIASSTLKPTGRKEPSGAEKKKAKLKREFLANLMVCSPEDPDTQKKKSEMFALAYYDKMRETLELDDYHKVMQILNDYEEGDAVSLYKKIEKVLRPKYIELADEFLLFLREKEAAAVSQLIPWIRMNNRSKFLKKLEVYFKDQPAQLRKIYKCLTELSQDSNVSIDKIKSTLLPMFKGNAVLTDLFLQNFLDEQPPPSLLDGPYETIDLKKESSTADDEMYETLTIPDIEDKYGGPSCICNCHHIEDPEFKSRFRHCRRCGTKFVKGKIYIQTGRGLRPATVSFLNEPNVDHRRRLLGESSSSSRATIRQCKGLLRQMVFTPSKENMEEDTDDEVDGQKRKKNSSGRRRKQILSDSVSKNSKHKKRPNTTEHGNNDSISPVKKGCKSVYKKGKYPVKRTKKQKKASICDNEKCDADDEAKQPDTFKPGSTEGQVKRFMDESSECEENVTTQDALDNLKSNSPEHQTAESESECCEESSQDNCESDSNSSTSSCNNQSQSDSNAGDEECWTRDEDKLILETFKTENHKERAFQLIAEKMKHRRISQIRNRFDTLMGILMETMIGN